MSAAGSGGLNREPCISEQPSAQQFLLLSTPSAVAVIRRAAAVFTTACGLRDIGDEAAADLDLVERKTLQVAQRGIAGAEIVQRDPDADRAKMMQDGERGVVIANENRLSNPQAPAVCKPRS